MAVRQISYFKELQIYKLVYENKQNEHGQQQLQRQKWLFERQPPHKGRQKKQLLFQQRSQKKSPHSDLSQIIIHLL